MEEKEKKVGLPSMERLAKVMNDSPTIVKMGEMGFPITALKPGTQWLIAEESCKIQKVEDSSFADVIKQFTLNTPSVVKIITLGILNDRDRIFSDYKKKVFSDEYHSVYETILWETNAENWLGLLVEIMNMLSLEFFFQTTNAIAMIREMALGKKKMMMTEGQK